MNDNGVLEQRVAALELEVAELRRQLAAATKPVDWLEAMWQDRNDDAMRELAEIVSANREAERRAYEASETP